MNKTVAGLVFILLTGIIVYDASAWMVRTNSISSGIYEDGKFTEADEGFSAEYVVDEENGDIRLERIIDNNREGRNDEGITYEITNTVVSKGISALLVSKNKKGQKIITASREIDIGVSEVLIIGEDFYEYCRASNGRFYLEYGEVELI